MGLLDRDCGCDRVAAAREDKCKGCVCELLKTLQPGTEVEELFVNGVKFDDDIVFINLDRETCCATFTRNGSTPKVIVIDCRKIDAIILEG